MDKNINLDDFLILTDFKQHKQRKNNINTWYKNIINMVEKGENLNVEINGTTPLIMAIKYNDLFLVKYLISKGADVNYNDPLNKIVISNNHNFYILEELINNGADLHNKDLLSMAINDNHINLANYLIFKGIAFDFNVLWTYIINNNNYEIAKFIINNKNVNDTDEYGNTALMYAISHHNIGFVNFLIENGADVNIKNKYGENVLFGLFYGHNLLSRIIPRTKDKLIIQIFDKLYDNGIDLNSINTNGDSFLSLLIRCRDVDGVKYLLDKNINININIKDRRGDNVLVPLIAGDYDVNIIGRFIDKGLDVNNQNNNGDTALFCAITYGRIKHVKFLISRGANINITNNLGRHSLLIASIFEKDDIIYELIESGVNINIKDNDGDNVIMTYQNLHKNEELLTFIFKHGIDLNAINNNNDTILTIASKKGYLNIIKIILQYI